MVSLSSSNGAFMIGTLISLFLAGVTLTQTAHYFSTFVPGDKKLWVGLVTILLVLDLLHTATSCYTIYFWNVRNFGNVKILARSPWTFSVEPALTGVVASLVHFFYSYRIWKVSGGRKFLSLVILFLSAVQGGFACGATAMIFVYKGEFARFQSWTYGVLVWLVVYRIVATTIETNSLASIVAIVDAVLFAALPSTSWHVILCLVKLYFNSVLVSLNSRHALASRLHGSTDATRHVSAMLELPTIRVSIYETTEDGIGTFFEGTTSDFHDSPFGDYLTSSSASPRPSDVGHRPDF
ncbi:hypothetical protein MNV49_004969 [Pseudohyphozyma bogoriensis]|nr:hypothetical protein MNV49_004969 [Pseudohyphozyma bogoriensis]